MMIRGEERMLNQGLKISQGRLDLILRNQQRQEFLNHKSAI